MSKLSQVSQNTFVTGSLIYLGSNALNGLVPLALIPILTQLLSPEEYGQVAMFHVLLSALIGLVGLSISGAVARKYYDLNDRPEAISDYLSACFQVILVSTFSFLILAVLLGHWVSELFNLDSKWIYWGVIGAAFSMVMQIRLSLWQVEKSAVRFGCLQVGHGLSSLLLTLLLVAAFHLGAEGRIASQVVSATAGGILAALLLKRDFSIALIRWSPELIKDVLNFGVPLIPHVVGGLLLLNIDRLVINRELGLPAAGIYMVAFQVSSALTLVFSAVNTAYVPWLFERLKEGDPEQKGKIVQNTYRWFLLLLTGAGVSFILGPPIISWLASEEYSFAGELIGWLILGQVFGGMYLMVTNYIFFSKKTWILSMITLTSGVLNLILVWLFVINFGLTGAAIAFTISMAVRFLLTWICAHSCHPMPWKRIF